jgi:hypothetical protein
MTKRQYRQLKQRLWQQGKQLALGFATSKRFIAVAACIATILLFYFAFVNYTEQYQAGLTLNIFTQDVGIQNMGGFHLTSPWTLVTVVDTRPQRVCVTSASRAFNCKLAQFDPARYKEFVATEGFRYYWWANRISFNFGYHEEYRGFRDILRGYAFGVKKYGFLKILEDY